MLNNSSTSPRDLQFSLLSKITDGFSEKRKVGSGGYGEVYKGKLDNGEEIAVKKLYSQPGLDEKQFTNELHNLMKVQHENIVRLVGRCYETQNELVEHGGRVVVAEREYRILCFEYLQGGSLDKHLYEEHCGLDWHTSYKIIKGICEGLNYLHGESILHLDLKPANILLDENMVPKIADFGLSRLFGETRTHITKNCIGTRKYMPPEYMPPECKITKKNDVFSLGVIIIEIMTGPEDYSKYREMSLSSEQFIELVHENWKKRLQATMSRHTSLEVKTCIEIALRCVEADRSKRPTITEIVDELNKIDTAKTSLTGQSSRSKECLGIDTLELRYNNMEMLNNSSTAPWYLQFALLRKITDGFSEERKVGGGTYGEVYKGKLDNAEEIAVKKLYPQAGLNEKQFMNELYSLTKVQHENIVRLVGYCYDEQDEFVQHNGKLVLAQREYRMLCFEYLHGGSLDKHLYEEYCGLDWHTCYKIIKGICEGLNYLHGLKDPILHLDLKPANILLDENMVPKIADFGLSRLFGEIRTHVIGNAIGTKKYMPPEYILECKISKKYDVFSLGVIIIQIMTGREGYSKYHETSSSEQFIELVHDEWKVRIEATSMRTSPEEDCKQVKRCIEIALNCVEAERHKRPTMGDIIHKLRETETMRHKVSMSFSQEPGSVSSHFKGEMVHNGKEVSPGLETMEEKRGRQGGEEDEEKVLIYS